MRKTAASKTAFMETGSSLLKQTLYPLVNVFTCGITEASRDVARLTLFPAGLIGSSTRWLLLSSLDVVRDTEP